MSETRKLDVAWLMLVLLSIGGAGLGGTADPDFGVTVVIALVLGIKVRLVCDHFLELGSATLRIRQSMYAFCYGMPVLVILTSAFGAPIARVTGALI